MWHWAKPTRVHDEQMQFPIDPGFDVVEGTRRPRGSGFESRRPFIYDSDANRIHVGPFDTWHMDLHDEFNLPYRYDASPWNPEPTGQNIWKGFVWFPGEDEYGDSIKNTGAMWYNPIPENSDQIEQALYAKFPEAIPHQEQEVPSEDEWEWKAKVATEQGPEEYYRDPDPELEEIPGRGSWQGDYLEWQPGQVDPNNGELTEGKGFVDQNGNVHLWLDDYDKMMEHWTHWDQEQRRGTPRAPRSEFYVLADGTIDDRYGMSREMMDHAVNHSKGLLKYPPNRGPSLDDDGWAWE